MVWTINLADGMGFTYSDMVRIHEVVEIGGSYNLVTDMGDVWLEKDCCFVAEDYIEYNSDVLTVRLLKVC